MKSSPLLRSDPVPVDITALAPADSPRAGQNPGHIKALAEAGDQVPPILVHRPTMRVIDGMHRLHAAVVRGQEQIEVQFSDVPERDAFVLGVELNTRHGLPLTRAERTAAAERVIQTHPHWSDRAIASLVNLSDKTIAAMRVRSTAENPQSNCRTGRDGRVRPLSTAVGRQVASRLMQEHPAASLREIARRAGVSVGTAQDVRKRLGNGQDPVPSRARAAQHSRGPAVSAAAATADTPRRLRSLPPEAAGDLIRQLRGDPSLRFSEAGRTLLRILDLHSLDPDQSTRLVECVPAHWVDAVAGVARGLAHSWGAVADQLEQRSGTKRRSKERDGSVGR